MGMFQGIEIHFYKIGVDHINEMIKPLTSRIIDLNICLRCHRQLFWFFDVQYEIKLLWCLLVLYSVK